MRFRVVGIMSVLAFVAAAVPALAHHATQAQYDKGNVKTLTGTLSKVQWVTRMCTGTST